MKELNTIFGEIRKSMSLFNAFEDGATPDDVKQGVIQLFAPYFKNQDLLEKMAVNVLMPNAIEFTRISQDDWALKLFKHTLAVHHEAKNIDKNSCLQACSDWVSATFEGLSIFWSQYNLELDTTSFELEEFLHETLRTIGAFAEGLIKPVAKAILHQVIIKNGEAVTFQAIQDSDFGKVINDLIQKGGYQPFLQIPPHSIRINQWRNIAQHFSARIEGDKIICRYGRPPKEKEIELTRDELHEIAYKVSLIYSSLRLAQQLFFIDNVYEIRALGFNPADIKMRSEAYLVNLSSGFASQGFEVIDFQKQTDEVVVVVKDATRLNPDERRFHTIQFINFVWLHTQANQIVIEYHEFDGTPNFRVRAEGDLCRKISEGIIEPSVLPEQAVLTDLKTNLIFPPKFWTIS